MSRERLYLFDTTLRDGAQTTGVDFSLDDKRHSRETCSTISASTMSKAAIPAPIRSTPNSSSKRPPVKARFAAFGMTKRAGRSAANDPGIAALLDADADAICFVAKSWDYHVRVALGFSLEENLEGIAQSIAAARGKGREAHARLRAFLRRLQGQSRLRAACAKAALDAGARWVVLCDTNGGTLPHEVETIVARCRAAHSRRSARHPRA